MRVKIKKLCEEAVVPRYARVGDAGMDLTAVSKRVCGNYVEYGVGLAFEVPKGFVMLVFPRSSCTKSDLIMGNSVAVIDSGYRGEVILRFNFIGDKNHYEVGDRIAQVMILPIPDVEFEEVEVLSESVRGEGRFGSTGR